MADPHQFDDLQQLAEYGQLLEAQLQGLLRATGQFTTLVHEMIHRRQKASEAAPGGLLAPGAEPDRVTLVPGTPLPAGVAQAIADRMAPEVREFRDAARKELMSRIQNTPLEKLKGSLLDSLDQAITQASENYERGRAAHTDTALATSPSVPSVKPTPVATRPVPVQSKPAGPTPVTEENEESDPSIRARLTLHRLFYGIDSIFTRYLAASVIAHGRGNISPTANSEVLIAYQDDLLQLEPSVAVQWPTGFYRNKETKGTQFFLNMEKEHQFSLLVADLSKSESPIYVVSYREFRELREFPSVAALQVIHDKALEALKALALQL